MFQQNETSNIDEKNRLLEEMNDLQLTEKKEEEYDYNTQELYEEPEDLTKQTPIQNRYCFWYMRRSKDKLSGDSYEKNIKLLGSFQTVEHFWRLYNHIIRPDDLTVVTDYHLFKDGISPTWEDPANVRGGKWMVRLRKGLAARFWEELMLAIIGEQFDVGSEVCGAVLSARFAEDIISLWNRNADNLEATARIRDTMRRVFRLPHFVHMEYKRHQESMTDNNSYRNTTVWRPERGGRAPIGRPGMPARQSQHPTQNQGDWGSYEPLAGGGIGPVSTGYNPTRGGGGPGGSGGRGYFDRTYSATHSTSTGYAGAPSRRPYSQERDWSKLRSTNPIEGTDQDQKRQSEGSVGGFYDRGPREPAWTGRNPFQSDASHH